MLDRSTQRGTTLLEAMVATAVLMIGAIGVLTVQKVGVRLNADARRVTRASAIAKDLVDQIAVWEYGDARLSNPITANDGDIGDSDQEFEQATVPTNAVDHVEADLTAGGAVYSGLATAEVDGGVGFQRFWNVSRVDDLDADGVPDAARIAVIVRWPLGGPNDPYRRIVMFTTKLNPAELR